MIDTNHSDLLIYGAGSQAKVTYDAVLKQDRYQVRGFVVDQPDQALSETLLGLPILSLAALEARRPTACSFIVALGDNEARAAKTRALRQLGLQPATVIHPHTSLGYGCILGHGTLICASAALDPEVTLGDGVIINGMAGVGHETEIGAFSHICGAALVGGNCTIGAGTFVGIGARVLSGLTIGRNAFVGAGALVTKDVPDNVLALGSPARFRARQAV